MTGARVLTDDSWKSLLIDGTLDASTIALELVDSRQYGVTFLPADIALIGAEAGDRYLELAIESDVLLLTLWADHGAVKGHGLRWPIADFNHARGPDELADELRRLLRRWGIEPSRATPLRRPAA